MQAAEKMVLDMFFRDGVGKDRKNSYVVAEKAESKASQTNDAHGAVDSKAEQVEKELAETSSIEPEKPVEDYPYNQREAIEGYADGVDNRILEFLSRVRNLKDHSYRQKTNVEIAQNTERLINDVRELVGTDVTGYKHLLTGGAVEHIDKDHGKNGSSDHSMANDEDIARIGFVIENYDSAELVKKNGKTVYDSEHRSSNNLPAPMIKFSKKINGTFYVVESVPDSKANSFFVKSAYIAKNSSANTDGVLNMTDTRLQPSRSSTSEPPHHSDSTAVNDSIRGNDVGNVGENVNNLQNKAASAAVKTDAVPEVTEKTDGKAETEDESKAKTVSEPKAKTEVKTEIKAEENPEETPKVDTEAKVQAKQEGKAEVPVEPSVREDMSREASPLSNAEAERVENVPQTESDTSKRAAKPQTEVNSKETTEKAKNESVPEVNSKAESEIASDGNDGISEEARGVLETIRRTAQSPKEALKAKKHGDVYSGADEQTIRVAEDLSKAFGVRVLLFDGNGKTDIDGFYDRKANSIYLNAGSHAKPIQATVRHEMVHFLAQANKGAFESFRDFVAGRYAETYGKDALNTWLDNKKAEYEAAGIELDENSAKEELCADLAMDMLTDAETVKGFAKENRSAARRILDALRRFIDKIRVLFGLEPKYSAGKARALEALAKTDSTVKITDGKVERSHASFKNDTLPKALNVKDLYAAEKLLYDTLVSDEVRNGNASSDGIRFSGEAETDADIITAKDIDNLRSIGRKSVNDFTSEDIKKAEPFARRYFKELGVKSPFFRAWFGDWRAHDTSKVKVVSQKSAERGKVKNTDTGWNILVSRKVFKETQHHSSESVKNAVKYLPYIGDITQNAVLLSSEMSGKENSLSVMFHTFYGYTEVMGYPALLRLKVEELIDEKSGESIRRNYILQTIEEEPISESKRFSKAHQSETGSSVNSISDLYALVKTYDKDFHAKDANPELLDEDGKPLVVYHGTDADFTVFDRTKGRSSMDIQGMFFSPWELDAQGYGKKVGAYYINLKNPADESTAYKALNMFKGQNNAGIKARDYLIKLGYDGVNNSGEEFIAFYPEQIKSATDNIGTFDGSNPDIRYSKSGKKVDKIGSEEYNNRIGKDEEDARGTDEFRRIQEASQRLSDKDIELFHNGSRRVNEGLRRRISGVFGRTLDAERRQLLYDTRILINPKTGSDITILKGVKADTFHDIFEIVQKFLKNGDAVDVHDVNGEYGYSNNVNFLSSTGLSGFSITPSGDLVSVFSLGEKGFLKTIRDYVKENGVITLDCYQSDVQPLADMYKKALGMKTASLLDFNYDILVEIKGKAYADFFVKTYGEAPVAFMVNTDEDVKTENFNKDQYDEAVAYRDSFIDKNTGGKSDGHTKTSEKESSDVLFSRSKDSVQTIPKGEAPARDVDVRAFDERGGNVSEGVRTVAEASVTPDSYVKPLLEDVAKGKYSHEVKTNKGAMARAENVITRDGYQETAERYLKDFEDGRSFGKDEIAVVQEWYKKVMSMMSGEIELDPLSEALIQDYMARYRDLLRKFDSAKQ